MRKELFLFVLFLFISAGVSQGGEKSMLAMAKLLNAEGETTGIAVLTEGSAGVRIAVNVKGIAPGEHAFHIHSAGSCKPPDFKSAGGHFNPFGRKHGIRNPDGAHAGDLPNVLAGPDGTAASVMLAPLATLEAGKNSLFRPGGTAIVIHAGHDDYLSDPAGNAGPRIACGVIKRVE
jgi:Cu-Zn family superoxide dismutase